MKELTIEEKAKAYDEALKYAMIYYKDGNEDMKTMMKTCFPVLVEDSEDEEVRKKLIVFLKQCKGVYGDGFKQFGLDVDDALAWLDKQGEQKHQYNSRPRYIGEEELLGEQNHTDKVERKSYASKTMNEKGDFDDGFTRMMEKEPKPAEWSEQDERKYNNIIALVEGKTIMRKDIKGLVSWFKSLKERIQPQPHWKPSKEQLHILESVIADYDNQGLSYTKDMLCDLYEQLKKL